MKFEEALKAMREGKKVYRPTDDFYNSWLEIQDMQLVYIDYTHN